MNEELNITKEKQELEKISRRKFIQEMGFLAGGLIMGGGMLTTAIKMAEHGERERQLTDITIAELLEHKEELVGFKVGVRGTPNLERENDNITFNDNGTLYQFILNRDYSISDGENTIIGHFENSANPNQLRNSTAEDLKEQLGYHRSGDVVFGYWKKSIAGDCYFLKMLPSKEEAVM